MKEVCTLTVYKNVIFAQFTTGAKIEYEHALQIVTSRKNLTGGKNHAVFLDGRGVVNVSKKARDYFASDEAAEGLIAGAIIINSPLTSILGNFFLKVSKPAVPSKIFTSEQEALKWLKGMVPETPENLSEVYDKEDSNNLTATV